MLRIARGSFKALVIRILRDAIAVTWHFFRRKQARYKIASLSIKIRTLRTASFRI